MKLLILTLTLLASQAVMAIQTSVRSTCAIRSCKVVACVNGTCRKFTNADSGKFIFSNTLILKLNYKQGPSLGTHFYNWGTRKYLKGNELKRNCPTCIAIRRKPTRPNRVNVQVNVDANMGNMSIDLRGTSRRSQPRNSSTVRRVGPSESQLIRIQETCDDVFSFSDETSCVEMLIEARDIENGLRNLKVIDDEANFTKLKKLELVLASNLSPAKTKICLEEMNFDDKQNRCLKIATRLGIRELNACANSGSFDSDKLRCMSSIAN